MFPVVFFRSSDSSLVNLSSTVAFPAVSAQFHPYNVSAGSCVHTDYSVNFGWLIIMTIQDSR